MGDNRLAERLVGVGHDVGRIQQVIRLNGLAAPEGDEPGGPGGGLDRARVPPRGLPWKASSVQAAALRALRPPWFCASKFGDGDFVLRFGHVMPFKHRHISHRHHHPALFFGFDQPRRFRPVA